MPELPEVETLKRELKPVLANKEIKSVEILWPKSVSPKNFAKKIRGQKILDVSRRAKTLVCHLASGEHLLIHLKMTGQLVFKPQKGQEIAGGHPEDINKYTRVKFYFAEGDELWFNDLRKFGWIKLLKELPTITGVEPLDKNFSELALHQIIDRYPNRKIKQILLDQNLIAGIGNIYADESCFIAKILPARVAKTLDASERKRLLQAIKKVLRLSISKNGTSARNYVRSDGSRGGFVPYLKVYGRRGLKCKRCRTGVIERIKLNGRGTHFCNSCQN